MEIIRTWLLSVTVSAMVIAAAEALMPAGAVKRVGKLTGGLILVLGILQPLVTMDYEDLYDMVSSLPAGAISQETLEEKTSWGRPARPRWFVPRGRESFPFPSGPPSQAS